MHPDPHRSDSCLSYLRWAVALLALSLAGRAAADGVPPDQCAVEGASCQSGGAPASPVGICTRSTCIRYYPEYPDSGSGGGAPIYKPHEVDCMRCIVGSPADAGTPDAGTSADGGDDEGCGCGLPGTEGEVPLAALMLGLGMLALRAGRRRR